MYRHPSTAFALLQENFMRVIGYSNEKNREFSIGGHINIKLLNCDQLSVDYLHYISSAAAR